MHISKGLIVQVPVILSASYAVYMHECRLYTIRKANF